MKLKFLSMAFLGVSLAASAAANKPVINATGPILPVSIEVSKRTPVDVKDMFALRSYASTAGYYFSPNLREGMRVLYSASYGIGGEAAQARGTIVQRDGRFYFKQGANPSSNLLLPPGLPMNSDDDVSLWDIGAYMDLVNRVAFSDPNKASHTANDLYGAPEANLVDFEGGTAGSTVKYTNALETSFSKSKGNRSESKLKIYYARGIGPVALEFREDMEPTGTFKFYLGD